MAKKCWIIESRRKGTNQKFENAGPYIFEKKSEFGNIGVLRRTNPHRDLRLRNVSCPKKVK